MMEEYRQKIELAESKEKEAIQLVKDATVNYKHNVDLITTYTNKMINSLNKSMKLGEKAQEAWDQANKKAKALLTYSKKLKEEAKNLTIGD